MAKLTEAMLEEAVADGAQVVEKKAKRTVKKPKPAPLPAPKPAPLPPVPDNSAEIQALRDEISQLRQSLMAAEIAAGGRAQELTALIATLSEGKPLRVKPVRDMDRNSPTYLLVQYYDFVPVTYKPRKLDS